MTNRALLWFAMGTGIGGLIVVVLAQVAATLGIEPKRLLGYLIRNHYSDPIGGEVDGQVMVYDWSLEPLRKRLAAVTSTPSISAVPTVREST